MRRQPLYAVLACALLCAPGQAQLRTGTLGSGVYFQGYQFADELQVGLEPFYQR